MVRARATCALKATNVDAIICHRLQSGREQFLVRWRERDERAIKANAICSWHSLEDLRRCLHFVQLYAERSRPKRAGTTSDNGKATSLKRKSPGADDTLSRAPGLLTPEASTTPDGLSGASSVVSISSDDEEDDSDEDENDDNGSAASAVAYNAVLKRKDGWITAERSPRAVHADATKLPTPQMLMHASNVPIKDAYRHIRAAFETKLKRLPKSRLENEVDYTTPSLDFTFIKQYVIGEGVTPQDPGAFSGCQRPCRPDMGQGIGCEYTRLCTCLEYATVDEKHLKPEDKAKYLHYKQQLDRGNYVDSQDLPKRFPYHKPKGDDDRFPQTLQQFYRASRNAIYECNQNCNCGPGCKSRVVQKGRKVPLTIFKTPTRGWGVKCDERLVQGEFIDTYLGEVITSAETDRREATGAADKPSYLYCLDKWADEIGGEDNCYVVDGQHMGGPTRFINHCCEPNIRQFTVSYNKHDLKIYDLAFFAIEDIPAGTELTFDYMDKDEEEEEDALITRAKLESDPANARKPRCNCGAKKCRGFLWV